MEFLAKLNSMLGKDFNLLYKGKRVKSVGCEDCVVSFYAMDGSCITQMNSDAFVFSLCTNHFDIVTGLVDIKED